MCTSPPSRGGFTLHSSWLRGFVLTKATCGLDLAGKLTTSVQRAYMASCTPTYTMLDTMDNGSMPRLLQVTQGTGAAQVHCPQAVLACKGMRHRRKRSPATFNLHTREGQLCCIPSLFLSKSQHTARRERPCHMIRWRGAGAEHKCGERTNANHVPVSGAMLPAARLY